MKMIMGLVTTLTDAYDAVRQKKIRKHNPIYVVIITK